MGGNSFGKLYNLTEFGESHGAGIVGVVSGCPSRFEIDVKRVQYELDRRKPGQSRVTSKRPEKDKIHFLSGVMETEHKDFLITTGAPIGLAVWNKAADSSKYENLRKAYRPGHADHTAELKWGIREWRGGGMFSARETIARVAGGAIAKQILEKFCQVQIYGYTACVGGVEAKTVVPEYIEQNMLRCPDPEMYEAMLAKVDGAIAQKDSIGGAVGVIAKNAPKGLGEPVFDKLQALLFHAFGSIGAVQGVEKGLGRAVESMLGSAYNDQMRAVDGSRIEYLTNHAGGIIGGISNGEDISFRLSVKPTPTRKDVPLILATSDFRNEEITIKGKHDPVIMPRMVPVAEAMMAITLLDCWLQQRAYEGLS